VVSGHAYSGSAFTPTLPAVRLTTAHQVKANTDVLTITRASSCGQALTTSVPAGSIATLTLNGDRSCPYQSGDYFMISDCGGSEIFQATSIASGSGQTTLTLTGGSFSRGYSHQNIGTNGIASVMRLVSTDYFISDNTAGVPILRRNELDGASGYSNTPLLEGVEDMSITYGIKGTAANQNVIYQSASAVTDWEDVASVRISLLMRSVANNLTLEPTGYTFAGVTTASDNMDASDHYLRRIYTTSIQIRERG
jgi:type IV pilus assembly protein PilW